MYSALSSERCKIRQCALDAAAMKYLQLLCITHISCDSCTEGQDECHGVQRTDISSVDQLLKLRSNTTTNGLEKNSLYKTGGSDQA